mmetsp:Transcript_1655/g.3169  ORF Transcript_1655/g.3169 Transcript_1655/m.3169 type:complete len:125 (+) Transcript_1655:886-1260(+)
MTVRKRVDRKVCTTVCECRRAEIGEGEKNKYNVDNVVQTFVPRYLGSGFMVHGRGKPAQSVTRTTIHSKKSVYSCLFSLFLSVSVFVASGSDVRFGCRAASFSPALGLDLVLHSSAGSSSPISA